MFGFLWDLHQHERINDIESKIAQRDREDRSADVVRRLENRVEALVLVNMALWSFMKEKLGVTEEQLQERVREIDLTDGELNGRVVTPPAPCPKCQRPISARHQRCLYCGTASPSSTAFGGAQ